MLFITGAVSNVTAALASTPNAIEGNGENDEHSRYAGADCSNRNVPTKGIGAELYVAVNLNKEAAVCG